MSIESDMEDFLPGALFTLVGTAFQCLANDIYFDGQTRSKREGTEILITTMFNPHVSQETGDFKVGRFNIELFKATKEKIQSISDTARIERIMAAVCDTIVKKYHGVPEEFMVSGSLNVLVDSVSCQRGSPLLWEGPSDIDNRAKAMMNISLEVLAYEEP